MDKLPSSLVPEGDRGRLFVVATPIGNLNDITFRALDVLKQVALIAAEDTRHSGVLLNHFGIGKPMLSLHDHNEDARVPVLLRALEEGKDVALISDAGTPLISDPGFRLVRELRRHGVDVVPVPGACAAVAALSASGLPTDRFLFAGFAPARQQARRHFLEDLAADAATLVFYESPRRIAEFLDEAVDVFGGGRDACVAKEVSKLHERFICGTLAEVRDVLQDASLQRGEFVVMIAGMASRPQMIAADGAVDIDKALRAAAQYLPPKQACALLAEITGADKKQLYQQWIALTGKS